MRTLRTLGMVAAGAFCIGLAACSGGTSTPPPDTPTAPAATSTSPSSPGVPSTSAAASVSKDRAGKIATDAYGGQVIGVEPDHAKDRATWEVELKDSRQGRIEVDVARDNGDIVATEPDNDDG